MNGRWRRGLLVARLLGLALAALALPAAAGEPAALVLATTTSVQGSGLLERLLPAFKAARGIRVRAVVAGTGQVLRIGRGGDADVLLTHDRESELRFVAEGFGSERRQVMHNDFVIVGPTEDPAGIAGLADAAAALGRIADAGQPFLSRGDDSGTHKAERRLWAAAGRAPWQDSGLWYRETGSGQGATLNMAAGIGGYMLIDRGTWLASQNRAGLAVLVEGDVRLLNRYGVIPVDPGRFPHVHAAEARAFVDWLTGAEGQGAIDAYRIDGRRPFIPDAAGSAG